MIACSCGYRIPPSLEKGDIPVRWCPACGCPLIMSAGASPNSHSTDIVVEAASHRDADFENHGAKDAPNERKMDEPIVLIPERLPPPQKYIASFIRKSQRKRPWEVRVIGYGSVAIGLWGILCGLMGAYVFGPVITPPERIRKGHDDLEFFAPGEPVYAVTNPYSKRRPNPFASDKDPMLELMAHLENSITGYWSLEMAKYGLTFILGLFMTLTGFRLLKMQPGAWRLAFLYAVAAILLHSAYLIFHKGWVKPAVDEWKVAHQINLSGFKEGTITRGTTIPIEMGVTLGAAVFLAHAGILLINVLCFRLPASVPPAFLPEPTGQPRGSEKRRFHG